MLGSDASPWVANPRVACEGALRGSALLSVAFFPHPDHRHGAFLLSEV